MDLGDAAQQALILVPLVASIVFGMVTSTVLIMVVSPAMYMIMKDIGFVTLSGEGELGVLTHVEIERVFS